MKDEIRIVIGEFLGEKFGYTEEALIDELYMNLTETMYDRLVDEYNAGYADGSFEESEQRYNEGFEDAQLAMGESLVEKYNVGWQAGYAQRRREEIEEKGFDETGRP